jgi:hypothetical protein
VPRREGNVKMDVKGYMLWTGGLEASGSQKCQVSSSCEHGTEPSGYVKGGEILDYMSDC